MGNLLSKITHFFIFSKTIKKINNEEFKYFYFNIHIEKYNLEKQFHNFQNDIKIIINPEPIKYSTKTKILIKTLNHIVSILNQKNHPFKYLLSDNTFNNNHPRIQIWDLIYNCLIAIELNEYFENYTREAIFCLYYFTKKIKFILNNKQINIINEIFSIFDINININTKEKIIIIRNKIFELCNNVDSIDTLNKISLIFEKIDGKI